VAQDGTDAGLSSRLLVTDVLNAPASASDHAQLADHLYAVNHSKDPQQAINRIAKETPFATVAHKISEVNHKHGPGWGAWLAGLLLPVVLPLGALFGQSTPQVLPFQSVPVVVTEEVVTRDAPLTYAPVNIVSSNEVPTPLTYEMPTGNSPTGSTPLVPVPAGSAPVIPNAETPITVTYDTAHSGQSLTITGPPYDVEVISNILHNFSPAAFDQLSPEQQHALAQRIFAEIGNIHSQQPVAPVSAQITLAASSQQHVPAADN
jgi:hypothetical protein